MHCETCGSKKSADSNNLYMKYTNKKFFNVDDYYPSDVENLEEQADLEIAFLQKTVIDPDDLELTAGKIDHKLLIYPFCIVFIPFPVLSWVCPCIGHYGIGMSDGVIRDFSQNYHVGINTLSYGRPTKYCKLDPNLASNGVTYDEAIGIATYEYLKQRDKPASARAQKSFVAESLNLMAYDNYRRWNRMNIQMMMIRHGRYTDFRGVLRTWLPFFSLTFICTILFYLIQAFSYDG